MKLRLGKKIIDKNSKPLLIAELSCNHCGSLKTAKKIILTAKKMGADFIKFQTYEAKNMTVRANNKYLKIQKGLWKGKYLWDLYEKAQTPFKWQKTLFDYAKKINIEAFSTPYDVEAVEYLEKINCPIYKIASFELTDLNLVKRIAQTNKPIIVSTGMADMKEIENTIKIIRKYSKNKFIILYCVSTYPAAEKDFHLYNIRILQKKFNCFVGLSDHSNSPKIASLAVSMGAKIFEKHIALENQNRGFDIEFSLKGKNIKNFKNNILSTWEMIKQNKYIISKSQKIMKNYRRSIFAIKKIKRGEKFSKENIKTIRPGYGLEPKYLKKLLNKKSPINLKLGEPLKKIILKKINLR